MVLLSTKGVENGFYGFNGINGLRYHFQFMKTKQSSCVVKEPCKLFIVIDLANFPVM